MTYSSSSPPPSVSEPLHRRARRIGLFALALMILPLVTFAQPAVEDLPPRTDQPPWLSDTDFFGEERGRRTQVLEALSDRPFNELLDRVWTFEYLVPVGGGQELFVTESFSLRSWLRPESRAILFLSGSVFLGNHWSIPVDGYNGPEMAAREGFFAFTVDYLGTGRSTIPPNGFEIEFQDHVETTRELVSYIRAFRGVSTVDLVGEGYGGGVATELAADPSLVRSVSIAAGIYREVEGGPLSDPNFVGFITNVPDGYFFSPAAGSLPFLQGAPQEAVDYVLATQSGLYPAVTFLAATNRPFFNPAEAQAPGLILYGQQDFIAVESDLADLAAEWGTEATLVVKAEAGHAPRTESPEIAAWFWDEIFDFIR